MITFFYTQDIYNRMQQVKILWHLRPLIKLPSKDCCVSSKWGIYRVFNSGRVNAKLTLKRTVSEETVAEMS